jgi:opacity protein-like surface antigen
MLNAMRYLIMLLLLVLCPANAFADFCNATPALKNEWEFIGGFSPQSGGPISGLEDRQFLLAGLAYSRVCWKAKSVNIAYTATFLPVAMVKQPDLPNQRSSSLPVIPAHNVYGLSALPLGFSFRFGKGAIQPFADMHGGVIASWEPVPIDAPDATGLNFIFDFGGGLRFKTTARSAVNVGYKFVHISNGYTTSFNPGLDNNVVFASVTLLR